MSAEVLGPQKGHAVPKKALQILPADVSRLTEGCIGMTPALLLLGKSCRNPACKLPPGACRTEGLLPLGTSRTAGPSSAGNCQSGLPE